MKQNNKLIQKLIDRVLENIKEDIICEDYTSINELLLKTPINNLIGFLNEEEWGKYKSLNKGVNNETNKSK